jgi:type II secretory pathway component PulF
MTRWLVRIELNRWWAKAAFTADARTRLYRKVAKMLVNGLPLLRILDELHDRATHHGKKPNEPMAIVLDDCRRMVKNGRLLSEGLPKTEQLIIMAGEQAGHLEVGLISVIDVVHGGKKIKAVILGGSAYPVAILFMILTYLYLFGTRVIPQFTLLVDPSGWHGAAKSMYIMSNVVQNWIVYVVAVIVAVIVAIIVSMPRWRGDVRIFCDRFAPFSIYRLMMGTSFLLAFSALQSAGITVEKSLARMSHIADPWLRERLLGALQGVRSGLNCGEALRNAGYGFPSNELVDDLCVYANYKGFPEALKVLADEWLEEGVEQVTMQMKILNGVAILALAFLIGWLVTGFFGIQHEIASMARRG